MRRIARLPAVLLALSLFFPAPAGQAHAREKMPRAAQLAASLENEFGWTALDKTDAQSPRVLHNLLLLLREGFPRQALLSLKSLRSFYAYAGHDTRYDLAAFHEEEGAISIGGASVWKGAEETDLLLLSTLAHELGHAWVFGKMSAADLAALAREEGGWRLEAGHGGLKAPSFLSRHTHPETPGLSLTSKLASRNVHEWYADAFAAAAMHRLGEKGLLGKDWRAKLKGKIGRRSWVDYNRLEPRLRARLDAAVGTLLANREPAAK